MKKRENRALEDETKNEVNPKKFIIDSIKISNIHVHTYLADLINFCFTMWQRFMEKYLVFMYFFIIFCFDPKTNCKNGTKNIF